MDMLSHKCTATEVSLKEKAVRVAPCSSHQTGHQEPDLGVPVNNTLTGSASDESTQSTNISEEPEDTLPTINDILSDSFAPAEGQEWYYIHAAHGKNMKAQEAFSREKIFTYIPEETVIGYSSDGKTVKKRKPIFTSYLFVLATHQQVKAFTNTGGTALSLPYLHFVYNRTDKNEFGDGKCITIRHRDMVNFMRLAKVDSYKVFTVDANKVKFLKDQPVKITEGVFKGIVGRVARIHNQTTVVVTLEGVVSMTTAYIPKIFMEPYIEK